MGAPKGNENGLVHGVYQWSATGQMPRKHKYLRTQLRKLRVELQNAVLDVYGREATPTQNKLITDIQRHEGIARLCEKRLAAEFGKLSVQEFLAIVSRIEYATDAGTRALEKLRLDESDVAGLRNGMTIGASFLPCDDPPDDPPPGEPDQPTADQPTGGREQHD